MAEVRIIVDDARIAYNGLFRVDELYNVMKQQLMSRGYFIEERLNREDILETGKQVVLELLPMRPINDYERATMKIEVHMKGIKDKVVTVDGHKQKYQQGEVLLIFFGYHRTDHRHKWENSGFLFLVRTIMDKFVRHSRTHDVQDMVKKDVNDVMNECRSYLNMTRFKISHDMHPHKG